MGSSSAPKRLKTFQPFERLSKELLSFGRQHYSWLIFVFIRPPRNLHMSKEIWNLFNDSYLYTRVQKNTLRVVIVLPERYLQEKLNLNYFVQRNYKGNREVDGLFISIVLGLFQTSLYASHHCVEPIARLAVKKCVALPTTVCMQISANCLSYASVRTVLEQNEIW